MSEPHSRAGLPAGDERGAPTVELPRPIPSLRRDGDGSADGDGRLSGARHDPRGGGLGHRPGDRVGLDGTGRRHRGGRRTDDHPAGGEPAPGIELERKGDTVRSGLTQAGSGRHRRDGRQCGRGTGGRGGRTTGHASSVRGDRATPRAVLHRLAARIRRAGRGGAAGHRAAGIRSGPAGQAVDRPGRTGWCSSRWRSK